MNKCKCKTKNVLFDFQEAQAEEEYYDENPEEEEAHEED